MEKFIISASLQVDTNYDLSCLFFLQDAFVQELSGSSLFTSMFKDDPEALKPQFHQQMAPLLQTYPFLAVI